MKIKLTHLVLVYLSTSNNPQLSNLVPTEFEVNISSSACWFSWDWKKRWRYSLSDCIQTEKHSPEVQNEQVIWVIRTKYSEYFNMWLCNMLTVHTFNFGTNQSTASILWFVPLFSTYILFTSFPLHFLYPSPSTLYYMLSHASPFHRAPGTSSCGNVIWFINWGMGAASSPWCKHHVNQTALTLVPSLVCHSALFSVLFSPFTLSPNSLRVDTFSRTEAGEGVRG